MLFSALAGRWGSIDRQEASCAVNPHSLEFSDDRTSMYMHFASPIKTFDGTMRSEAHYRVLQVTGNALRMEVDGETRRQTDGTPVAWDLRLTSDSTYCWHRADWPYRSCTEKTKKCD
jgi:hypothetical protein